MLVAVYGLVDFGQVSCDGKSHEQWFMLVRLVFAIVVSKLNAQIRFHFSPFDLKCYKSVAVAAFIQTYTLQKQIEEILHCFKYTYILNCYIIDRLPKQNMYCALMIN